MRPFRITHAVTDATHRIDEYAPSFGTPAERRILVRQLGVDAQRVHDVRVQELAATIQRGKLLAQSVDRLSRCERERCNPALFVSAEAWQARPAAEVLISDRNEDACSCTFQHHAQRIL